METIKTLSAALLGMLVAGVVASPEATADTMVKQNFGTMHPFGHGGRDGDGVNVGNGKHNKNSLIFNSPSYSHDVGHVRNVNVDGNTLTNSAICRRLRRCKIIQHNVTFEP
jgi:hypothetical protein